jgi:hypothetical protein
MQSVSLQFQDITATIEAEEESRTGFRCRFSPPAPSVWLTLFSDLMKRLGDGINAGLFTLDSEGASVICTPEDMEQREEAVRTAIQSANAACKKMLGQQVP